MTMICMVLIGLVGCADLDKVLFGTKKRHKPDAITASMINMVNSGKRIALSNINFIEERKGNLEARELKELEEILLEELDCLDSTEDLVASKERTRQMTMNRMQTFGQTRDDWNLYNAQSVELNAWKRYLRLIKSTIRKARHLIAEGQKKEIEELKRQLKEKPD